MKVQTGDLKWKELFLKPSGDTLPIGSITQFAGSKVPTNWLSCNGQAVSRNTYSLLFKTIGTTYGEGDGSTTFNLPSLEEENTKYIIKAKNSIGVPGNVVNELGDLNYNDVPSTQLISDYINGDNPMGSIVVEDIKSPNLYNPSNVNVIAGNYYYDYEIDNTKPYVFQSPYDWTLIYGIDAEGNETRSVYEEGKTSDSRIVTFVPNSNEVKIRCAFYNESGAEDFSKVQLEQNETATDIVPFKKFGYNGSESMGKIVVDDIKSKNLMNIVSATGTRGSNTIVAQNQQITLNSSSYGTETSFYLNDVSVISQYLASSIANAKDYKITNAGGIYRVTYYVNKSNLAFIIKLFTNKRAIQKSDANIVNNKISFEIELEGDEYIKSVQFYAPSSVIYNNFVLKCQIEKGSVETPYVEHKEFSGGTHISTGVECKTGRIVDGKEEYVKRINCGAMPNNTTKEISTGLSNVRLTRPAIGYYSDTTQWTVFDLSASSITWYVTKYGEKISIKSTYDMSDQNETVVEIYYVKK